MNYFMVLAISILYLLTWVTAGILIGRDEHTGLDYSSSLPVSAKATLCLGFLLAILIAVYSDLTWQVKLTLALLGGLACYAAWAMSRRFMVSH